MQRKTKQLSLGFGLLLAIFLTLTFDTQSTSAFSLNITTSGPISTNVIPASDGSMGTSIVTDEINITSNCRSGYTFTIASPSDNNLYLNGEDANNSSGTYFTPVNGTNALNHTANTNKWGYTLTNNASSSTIFSPLSSTATTLRTPAQTASATSDIDHTIPIHYGTAVDGTMNPGSYTFANNGTITYTVTMDPSCLNYSVQYQGNNPDNPNGMGTTDESTGEKSVRQTNIAEGTAIILLPPNFKKQGHSFLGWSTDENAYTHFTDNDNTNDPIIYGPMETVTIDSNIIATANARNQINMYAVWLPALRTNPADSTSTPVYFQDWDNPNTNLPHDGCSTLTQTVFDDTETNEKDKIKVSKDSVVALTDKRDNQVYTVARLADGKCWMTENLRLDAEYTRGNNINDPTVINQYLSQGYGGTTGTYGNFVGLADSENANFSNVTTSNSIYKSSTYPPVDTYDSVNQTLEDIGTTGSPGYRFPRYNNWNTLSHDDNNSHTMIDGTAFTQNYINATPTNSGVYSDANVYSYGNYYTWPAAIANTNQLNYTPSSETVGTSICPSGWSLPSSGNTEKEYSMLSRAYGGTGGNQNSIEAQGGLMASRLRLFPNSFVYSGSFRNAGMRYRGSGGYYWSKSASNTELAYRIIIDSTTCGPMNGFQKYNGFTARCLTGSSNTEIVLNSNDGNSNITRLYGEPGASISLSTIVFARFGYGLTSWNTAPDGSGTTYTNSYTIPAGSTGETLYAQWIPQYTITYVNDCQSYASANPSCTQAASGTTSIQKINLDSSGNGSGTLKASNAWTTMGGWKIAGWNTSADGTGTEYRVSSTYAVTGQSAGDGITLYAHWVPTYSIQYDGNGASNPNGMGTMDDATGVKSVKQTNVIEDDPITLLASNFKKAENGFVGWSTDPDAWSHFTDNDSTNDPVIYGPMETISAPAYPTNGTNIITMYAVWVPAEKDGSNNPIYLQEWDDPTDTTDGCAALTSTIFNSTTGKITAAKDSILALTDKRDDEVYAIAKLADDNCWMIENLRLEHEGTVGNNKNDSSVTNESLSQGYGGTPGTYGNFVGLATSESANFSNSTIANTIYKSDDSGTTFDSSTNTLEDIGTSNSPGYRFPRYNSSNTKSLVDGTTYTQNYINTYSPSDSGTNYRVSSNIYSYGNYYTWAAAMANTSFYASSSASEAAGTSICPSGWYLPSSHGTAKIFNTLSQRYGGTGNNQSGIGTGDVMSNRFRSFPNNFSYSGYFNGSSTNVRGNYGFYWSRSANSNGVYVLGLTSTGLNPHSDGYGKLVGFSVRCLMGS